MRGRLFAIASRACAAAKSNKFAPGQYRDGVAERDALLQQRLVLGRRQLPAAAAVQLREVVGHVCQRGGGGPLAAGRRGAVTQGEDPVRPDAEGAARAQKLPPGTTRV